VWNTKGVSIRGSRKGSLHGVMGVLKRFHMASTVRYFFVAFLYSNFAEQMHQERIQSLNVDLKKARVYLTTLVSEQNSVYMVSHQ
jgi:hypothetical protein